MSGVEAATWVGDLNTANPDATDPKGQGDDHLRLIKAVLKTTLPNASKAFYFPNTYSTKSADYTVLSTDQNRLIPFDATALARTATLPSLAAGDAGWSCIVQKVDSSANGVVIDPPGAGTINGAATLTIAEQYDGVFVIWTGTEFMGWFLPTLSATSDALIAPTGTLMLFQQTTPPSGWTKSTTHNDKVLRVVSGTPSSGGTNAFSTVMAQTAVGNHSLTEAELPVVTLNMTYSTITYQSGALTGADNDFTSGSSLANDFSVSFGSGTAHNHSITMDMQYVDLVIASKD